MQRNLLIKSLPIVASALGKSHGVKVSIRANASTACTNGKEIILPVLPETDEAIVLARGYIDHESAHIRYTDFSLPMGKGLRKSLVNVLEDIRIEQQLGITLPGCRINLEALEKMLVEKGMYKKVDINSHPAEILMARVHHCLRVGVLNNLCTSELATNAMQVFANSFPPAMVAAVDNILMGADRLRDTQHVCDMADEILKAINEKQEEEKPDQSCDSDSDSDEKQDDEQSSDCDSSGDSGDGESKESDSDDEQDGEQSSGSDSDDSDSDDEQDDEQSSDGNSDDSDSDNEQDDEQSSDGNSDDSDSDDEQDDEQSSDGNSDDSDSDNEQDSEQSSGSVASDSGADTQDGDDQSTDEDAQRREENRQKLMETQGEEVVEETDLGDLLESIISDMNYEAKMSGNHCGTLPSVFIPRGSNPIDVSEAARETNALRTRLNGLVQATKLKRSPPRRVGARIDTRSLHKLSTLDTRIFRGREDKQAINTGVVVFIDQSSSMNRDKETATKAAMAVSLALESIQGVQLCVAGFSSESSEGFFGRHIPAVRPMKLFNQRIDRQCFKPLASGGTPIAEALWWGASELFLNKKIDRRVILVVTDGDPDDFDRTADIAQKVRDGGIETYAIGINKIVSKSLFPISCTVSDVSELPNKMFGMLQDILVG